MLELSFKLTFAAKVQQKNVQKIGENYLQKIRTISECTNINNVSVTLNWSEEFSKNFQIPLQSSNNSKTIDLLVLVGI